MAYSLLGAQVRYKDASLSIISSFSDHNPFASTDHSGIAMAHTWRMNETALLSSKSESLRRTFGIQLTTKEKKRPSVEREERDLPIPSKGEGSPF